MFNCLIHVDIYTSIHFAKSLAYSSFKVQKLNAPQNIQTPYTNSKLMYLEKKRVVVNGK